MDAIEAGELARAISLSHKFRHLALVVEVNRRPSLTRKAIGLALTKCESQIMALGGEVPDED